MDKTGALCSHDPLYFAARPEARSEMTKQAASRLLFISNWKLSSETACEEPRLRKVLGHISVYDKTRDFSRAHRASSGALSPTNELSHYLQQHVPSFKEFQAAIEVQLATMAQVTAAAAQLTVNDPYDPDDDDEEEDDSDYESYDGDWTDEDTAAESDDSFTDNESLEGQMSECSSPTRGDEFAHGDAAHDDLWAVKPLPALTVRRPLPAVYS